jgi:hypothetical protein
MLNGGLEIAATDLARGTDPFAMCRQANEALEAQLQAAQKAQDSSEAQAAQFVEAENKVYLLPPLMWLEIYSAMCAPVQDEGLAHRLYAKVKSCYWS